MSYAIYLVKASRKPVYVSKHNHIDDAIYHCDCVYDNYLLMKKHDMAASGVSAQIIHEEDVEEANQIQIGGFDLHKIKPVYSCGGW